MDSSLPNLGMDNSRRSLDMDNLQLRNRAMGSSSLHNKRATDSNPHNRGMDSRNNNNNNHLKDQLNLNNRCLLVDLLLNLHNLLLHQHLHPLQL